MRTTSNRIRHLRSKRGWDLDDLASRAHVGVTTVRKLERGDTRRPRESTAQRIADALEVPLDQVFPNAEFATTGHDPVDHGTCDDCGTPAPHSMGHCVDALQTTVDALRARLTEDVRMAWIEGHEAASDPEHTDHCRRCGDFAICQSCHAQVGDCQCDPIDDWGNRAEV